MQDDHGNSHAQSDVLSQVPWPSCELLRVDPGHYPIVINSRSTASRWRGYCVKRGMRGHTKCIRANRRLWSCKGVHAGCRCTCRGAIKYKELGAFGAAMLTLIFNAGSIELHA